MLKLTVCPACRVRMSGDEALETPCRRCGSDLSLLRQTYAAARALRSRARRALAVGQDRLALGLAREAVILVDSRETRATLCASLVATGRPRAALMVFATPR